MHLSFFFLSILFAVPALFLFILTMAAIIKRFIPTANQAHPAPFPGHIAIVVPAHNEEKCIQKTIESLKLCLQNDINASIHLIADNCSDNTVSIGKESAVQVWERLDAVNKSKGYALEWAIPQVLEWGKINNKNIVCVAIIDADCTTSENSLAVARNFLDKGAKVMQSEYIMMGCPNALASIAVIGMAAMNIVRGLGRLQLGISDLLKGSGVWITSEVLEKYPWKAATLAEDLEYSIILASNDISVKFMQDSVCLSDPPQTKQALKTQRQRWESGRLAMVLQTLPHLIKLYIRKPSANLLGIIFDLIIPPLGLLVFLYAVAAASYFIIPSWIAISSAISIMLIGVHVVLTIPLARLSPKFYLYLFYTPFYILWKIVMLPKIIANKTSKKWIRTER